MRKPSPSRLFSHVIYEYRWFAVAAYAWNQVGPFGKESKKAEINKMIPGIGVLIQDSLLIHARQLIEFYIPRKSTPTDIVFRDFGFPEISPNLKLELEKFRHPIEVHVGHLTAYRDIKYRNKVRETSAGSKRQRPEWNKEISKLITLLFQALDEVVHAKVAWSGPFSELNAASIAVLNDAGAKWPSHLSRNPMVERYIKGLNL